MVPVTPTISMPQVPPSEAPLPAPSPPALPAASSDIAMSVKFKNEEKILTKFSKDSGMVFQSLERISVHLQSKVVVDDIFESELCKVLFTVIRPSFPATTSVGRKCRDIWRKLQAILKTSPDCPANLPEVTVVETPTPTQPAASRRFQALFGDNNVSIQL